MHPRAWRYPAGYGCEKRVPTAAGVATDPASAWLPVAHADTSRAAAASGVLCGAVAAQTVVGGTVGGVDVVDVADVVAVPPTEWLELQPDTTTAPATAAAASVPRTVRDTTQSVADRAA